MRIVRGATKDLDTLVIRLNIHNTSATNDLSFTSWGRLPPDAGFTAHPKLRSSNRTWAYVRAKDPPTGTLTIPAGKSVQEEYTFKTKDLVATDVWLDLRMPPLSEQGRTFTFVIPQDQIKK